MGSAGKSACLEKALLVRPARTAQDRIAVREASEAPNDVGVPLGICREFSIAVVARELQAAFLVGKILRMHQRQIEELPLACGICRSKPCRMARSATERATSSVA